MTTAKLSPLGIFWYKVATLRNRNKVQYSIKQHLKMAGLDPLITPLLMGKDVFGSQQIKDQSGQKQERLMVSGQWKPKASFAERVKCSSGSPLARKCAAHVLILMIPPCSWPFSIQPQMAQKLFRVLKETPPLKIQQPVGQISNPAFPRAHLSSLSAKKAAA